MELFAYRVKFNDDNYLDLGPDGKYPDSTFNTFLESFLSVFIVLANDGWTEIYFNHYRSTDPVASTLYFITLLVIGQFILLNLFIAILIENFEQVSLRSDTVDKHNNSKRKKGIKGFLL
jgi:hypothetical protein